MTAHKIALISLRKTLTGPRYIDSILQAIVIPWRNGFSENVFMQYSASLHTSLVAKIFLEMSVLILN